ncbi:hypothetical protein HMPREF0201_00518 [Cedecea davisae DSM 4568]|uniref:Uncharacterized protein n=1 Tax=Cedecea davisae DSM 4568 TaxID=566551 RepID=S3J4H5_9ENTR|nr:hypothetical protein HMPREF0201_00518 [Cedecea davisae DSM 4568]
MYGSINIYSASFKSQLRLLLLFIPVTGSSQRPGMLSFAALLQLEWFE